MYYLCTSEEERTLNTGLSPLFFAQYKGCNTSEVGNSRCFIGNFLGFIGNFLGFIGERIADVEIFFAAEIIKDIKVFRAKKVGF